MKEGSKYQPRLEFLRGSDRTEVTLTKKAISKPEKILRSRVFERQRKSRLFSH